MITVDEVSPSKAGQEAMREQPHQQPTNHDLAANHIVRSVAQPLPIAGHPGQVLTAAGLSAQHQGSLGIHAN
jgi:hypothetical protein